MLGTRYGPVGTRFSLILGARFSSLGLKNPGNIITVKGNLQYLLSGKTRFGAGRGQKQGICVLQRLFNLQECRKIPCLCTWRPKKRKAIYCIPNANSVLFILLSHFYLGSRGRHAGNSVSNTGFPEPETRFFWLFSTTRFFNYQTRVFRKLGIAVAFKYL